MTVCHVCGTENQPGATYCEGCGVELQTAGAAQPAPMPGASPEPEHQEVLPPSTPAPIAPSDDAAVTSDGDAGPASLEPALASGPIGAAEPADLSAPEGVPPDLAGSIGEPLPALPEFEPPTPAAPTAPADSRQAGSGAAVSAPAPAVGGAPADARLEPKQGGNPTSLGGTRVTVGRFDPSTGPVDVDLSSLPGAEHISRRHAELFVENGRWMVRDLGSTNGVYVKRAGEQDYGARLQSPYALASGDEVAFGNVQFVYREGSATA